MKFILTTNPGIEDIVEKEIKEKVGGKFFGKFLGMQGKVLVDVPKRKVEELFKLRSIYHIIRYVGSFEIRQDEKGLEDVYKGMKSLDIAEMESAKSFRVTSRRTGEHAFTSVMVQKYAGQALVDKYKKKVDLKGYEVNVICNVFGKRCYVGVQLTRESLHKRFKRPFNHPAAIKAPLAFAMLTMAEIKEGDSLLDPFCGGATIPIEAAQVWGGKIRIYASDCNEEYLEGARKNSVAAGVGDLITFTKADARKLESYFEEKSFDKIVTNPPYGVKMAKDRDVKPLYQQFLLSAEKVLKDDGRIVLITLRAGSFRVILARTKKFHVFHERVVESGGLYPHVFILERM